jgi:hypothetical protein
MELCQVGLRAYLLTAKINKPHFRFSAVTDQGIKNHTNAEATALAVRNPSALLHVRVFFDSSNSFFVGLKS